MQGSSILRVRKLIQNTWRAIQTEIGHLGGEVALAGVDDAFLFIPEGEGITVELKPICLLLKEKYASVTKDLYAIVAGKINFRSDTAVADMRISTQGAMVGYFRRTIDNKLEHVFGGHYDFDPKHAAHPIFHLQLKPMHLFVSHINEQFKTEFLSVEPEKDYVSGILKNVRIPTAQMDVFSVLLQVIGDHLVSDETSKTNKLASDAYDRLCGVMIQIKGDPFFTSRLLSTAKDNCFRSGHWY